LAHVGSFGRDGVTKDEAGKRKVQMSGIMWLKRKDGWTGLVQGWTRDVHHHSSMSLFIGFGVSEGYYGIL
jgi:hypothetical protein